MKKERIMKDGVDGGFIEISSEQQSSITLSKNAHGGYGWVIKIYQDNPDLRKKEVEDTVEWVEGLITKRKQENNEG